MTDPRLKSREQIVAEREARRQVKDAMRTPIKKVNKERGGQRSTVDRDPDYLAWVPTQPSILSGVHSGEWRLLLTGFMGFTQVVPAHMKHGRTGGCDQTALPLEWWEHDEMHRIGIKSWAKKYNLDLPALIAAHRKRYALEMAEKVKAK